MQSENATTAVLTALLCLHRWVKLSNLHFVAQQQWPATILVTEEKNSALPLVLLEADLEELSTVKQMEQQNNLVKQTALDGFNRG